MAVTIIPALAGWDIYRIDAATGVPVAGSVGEPVVAWKVSAAADDACTVEPLLIGSECAGGYICTSPDGRAVVPEFATFPSLQDAINELGAAQSAK